MSVQSQLVQVAAHFDADHRQWQDCYQDNTANGHLLQTRLDRAMVLCDRYVTKPGRALDLGSGCGPATIALAKKGHNVLGVDVAPAMIAQGNRQAEAAGVADRCRLECRDFAKLDLPTESFDIIVALGFIEYFDDAVSVLARIHTWLADDGILVLQTPNRYRLTHLLQGRVGCAVEPNGDGLACRQYAPGEIADLARACGLIRIDYRGHAIGPVKIAGRFVPGYRASMWLERRMDHMADGPALRWLGRLGTSFISVFRKMEQGTP